MKALLDTNVFLEIILAQEKAADAKNVLMTSAINEFHVSDYSLHSIGLLLIRRKQHHVFRAFLDDVIVNGALGVLGIYPEEMELVIDASQKYNLDFDDAYQYAVAKKHELELISFDADFQRTDRGFKTPTQLL